VEQGIGIELSLWWVFWCFYAGSLNKTCVAEISCD